MAAPQSKGGSVNQKSSGTNPFGTIPTPSTPATQPFAGFGNGSLFAPTAAAPSSNSRKSLFDSIPTSEFNFDVGNITSKPTTPASAAGNGSTPKASPSEPPRKKFRFDDEFTVLVGKDLKRFTIHDEVFSNRSRFFSAACAGNFKEKLQKTVRLPEVEPDMFRSYMQWAYCGEVVVPTRDTVTSPPPRQLQLLLGELFTLANFLGDPGLKNKITDEISTLLRNSPALAPELVTHLYENAPDSCYLRKFILDWVLYKPTGTWLEVNRSALPSAFLGDIAVTWAKFNCDKSKLVDPHSRPLCFYHEHGLFGTRPCSTSKS